ncbi:MAG: hypothetical protein ACRBK7_03825 [Acidimicrobiales bacterium]
MTYRYLPWVRRGLAASITNPDTLDDRTAATASFEVATTINNAADPVTTPLRLNGPGDVTGVDTRVITRTDPERFVADFEPNNLATIEFDQPDFPWMFTPAKANAQGRLRPWLVLVVVENHQGVSISVRGDSPLPVLDIGSPAVAADELPNLADSWAWAHAQVITENDNMGEIADEIATGDELNLARLFCPRRLQPNRRYFACLVPAFEVGRIAGTGGTPDPAIDLAPAWDFTNGSRAVSLPVYFHWEFGTSSGGSDFEDLVDRLQARELDESAGTVAMAVNDRLLGAQDDSSTSVLGLEGALRPISTAAQTIADVPQQIQAALRQRLNASSEGLTGGTPEDEPPIGPPIYGAYHAATHEVGQRAGPQWLDQLNLDPRLRVAAALGASVVRDHQEELMDEAWAQVGDVIAANNVLNQAALSEAAAASAFKRNIEPLRDDRLFTVTSPAHRRTADGRGTIRRTTDRSRLPNATTDPAFRRATSPQNRALKRAARRQGSATHDAGSVDEAIVARIDDGSLPLEDFSTVPDGISPTEALQELAIGGAVVDMSPIGGVGSVPSALVQLTMAEARNIGDGAGKDLPLAPRADLFESGLLTDAHIGGVSEALGRNKSQLLARVAETITTLRAGAGDTGIELVIGPEGVFPRPGKLGLDPEPDDSSRTGDDKTVDDTTDDGKSRGKFLPFPDRSQQTTRAFGRALTEFSRAFEGRLSDDEGDRLDLGGLRGDLLRANNPTAVAIRRTKSRVDRGTEEPNEPFDPIMASPQFPTPLHQALADKSRDHFLPGIGDLPPNSFVIVETNNRFVESFLVGANHEMNHELLWREYPTDRRGTPFQHFWNRFDGSPDIDEIHTWNPPQSIGENQLGGLGNQIVLLIRAELLQHYPNTIIYAAPAQPGNFELDTNPSRRVDPTMIGRLDPDVTFVMLPINKEQLLEGAGHYIVFQEQPTELRFGLDSPSSQQPDLAALADWNDLTWGHADTAAGQHLSIGGNQVETVAAIDGAKFGRNSSDMAKILLQRPVMVAYYASALLKVPAEGDQT